MPVYYHETLPVYRAALAFAVAADTIARRLPRELWWLKDQLWRASTSILFNIAEATGGHTPKVRSNYFRIARGSAAECSAVFDYIVATGLMPREELPFESLRSIGAQLGTAILPHLKKTGKQRP